MIENTFRFINALVFLPRITGGKPVELSTTFRNKEILYSMLNNRS